MSVSTKARSIVYHYLLEDHAKRHPDKPLLLMNDRTMTYGEVDRATSRIGRGFAAAGVVKGDRVLVMLPSSIEMVLVWLGLSKIGALMVPVNEAYKAGMLQHQVNNSGARLAVIWNGHLKVWHNTAENLPELTTVFVYQGDTPADAVPAWTYRPFTALFDPDDSPLPPAVEYYDPMAIFYTSGTTGPSKGVLYSYAQAHATATPPAKLCSPDDIFYMTLPMFHVALSHMFGIVIIAGASMAVRGRFSVSNFWSDIRNFRATFSILLSTMPNFLMSQAPSTADRDHTLKKLIMIPLLRNLDEFKERFGISQITTFFNMTEVSCPIAADGWNLKNLQSCGRPRPGIQARIVDENDEPLPPGKAGELVLRADNPWELNLGYWRNEKATAQAWRNQWLHTGDGFSYDEGGNFYFVDRIKDCLRRRGENISSFEVEVEVDAHPAIRESAAVAVPSDLSEDELKVVASLKPGCVVEPADLLAFLKERLPAYMVPRYIEIIADELPKTPTGKVQKVLLRATGVEGAWDRERA
ncbi:MAG: putative crotonobetaine/carnitine-CoA ligase [Rhodospirillales bacterium]|nr:putative crotonobetaine/carnitine-CoA ligase [Rhodospirillales bacterium]